MSLTPKEIGSALLILVEGDAASAFAPVLAAGATAEQAAQGDPIKLGTAYLQLQANLFAAGPQFLAGLQGQLASVLAARFAALASAGAAKVTSALATLEGTTTSTAPVQPSASTSG